MDLLLPWLRRTGWAYVAVAVALALISWRLLADGDRVQGTPPDGASVRTVGTGATASPPAARLVVHVTGAVRRPGVYALPEGARVQRAVARAGGPTRVADLGALNLAAQVQDGQQVVVPVRARPGAAAPAGATGTPGAPVSLSRASAEELDGLTASARPWPRASSPGVRRTADSPRWTSCSRWRASVRRASSRCAPRWCRDGRVARGCTV